MILVKIYWNSYADGTPAPENIGDDGPLSYYGPFDDISDAENWIENDFPDGDTDVRDMIADDFAIPTAQVKFVNAPDSIFGDIPDEDIRDDVDDFPG